MRINSGHCERIAGLDVLRSIAITFVLVYHLPFGDHVAGLGIFGVEIFLTLSGFLVASMIFERFGGIQSTGDLQRFLANRWLRTLPLYYLAMAATACVTVQLDPSSLPDTRTFFVFMQNLTDGGQAAHGAWFGASWSLALEEWFYLLLPVVLWLTRGKDVRRTVVMLSLALIILAVGGRGYRYATTAGFDFDEMYRRAVIFRLDTFCWGMLVYLAITRWDAAVMRWRYRLCGLGLAMIIGSVAMMNQAAFGQAFLAIGFLSIVSAATAMFIPFFCGLEISGRTVRELARFISTRTYALYLTHGLVYTLAAHWLSVESAFCVPVMIVGSVIGADLIYRFIERPILALAPRSREGTWDYRRFNFGSMRVSTPSLRMTWWKMAAPT